MLVLNNRDWQGNVWLPENELKNKQHYKNQNTKTYHKASNATKNAVSSFKQA